MVSMNPATTVIPRCCMSKIMQRPTRLVAGILVFDHILVMFVVENINPIRGCESLERKSQTNVINITNITSYSNLHAMFVFLVSSLLHSTEPIL